MALVASRPTVAVTRFAPVRGFCASEADQVNAAMMMAFEEYSLFLSKRHDETSTTTGVMGIGGTWANAFAPIPNGTQCEQDTNAYVPWSQNADDDDPYQLIQFAKKAIKSEQGTGPNGLVSNILEGASCLDNYFTEGKSIWSPDTLRDDVLQYFEKTDPHPADKMSSLYVDPYDEGPTEPSSIKPIVIEQHKQEEINKFVSHFQNVILGKQDGLQLHYTERQAMEMLYEDSLNEQRKYNSGDMSAHTAPTMQIPGELLEELEACQRERNGVSKQLFQRDVPVNGFGPQNTEYFQKPKPNSPWFNPINSSQYNIATPNGNPLPSKLNVNANQYSHHSQQTQDHVKLKQPTVTCETSKRSKIVLPSLPEFAPQNSQLVQREYSHGDGPSTHYWTGRNQVGTGLDSMMRAASESGMQLDKNTMLNAAVLAEAFLAQGIEGNTSPHTSIHMGNGDRKQGLPQNSPQQFRGHNTNGVRKKLQSLPVMYPICDPIQSSGQMPFRPPNFNSRSTLAYPSDAPLMIPDTKPIKPYVSDLMGWHGEIYPGMTSLLRSPSMMKNQWRPVCDLNFYLDKCYEEWRSLETERKQTEVILTETFPGKRISVVTNSFLPKTPPNPSRVDRLVADQMREQATVASLFGQMECLRSIPFHSDITSAIDRHQEAIWITRARRKEEYVNTGGTVFGEDRVTQLLAMALKDLSGTTRASRTALWCALQMTLPRAVEHPDFPVDSDDACEDSSSVKSLFLYGII